MFWCAVSLCVAVVLLFVCVCMTMCAICVYVHVLVYKYSWFLSSNLPEAESFVLCHGVREAIWPENFWECECPCLLSWHSSMGVTDTYVTASSFTCVMGIWIEVLSLVEQPLYPLSHLCSPQQCFYWAFINLSHSPDLYVKIKGFAFVSVCIFLTKSGIFLMCSKPNCFVSGWLNSNNKAGCNTIKLWSWESSLCSLLWQSQGPAGWYLDLCYPNIPRKYTDTGARSSHVSSNFQIPDG